MVWLVVLGCLLLIGLLPLGICVRYGQKGAKVWIIAGPFHFLVHPGTERKRKRKSAGSTAKKDTFESHAQVKKKRSKLSDYFPIVRLVLDFLIDFRTRLRINDLQLKVILAGSDPCDLSINYGRAWAALGNLMPLLERCFQIKKRSLEIECDYVADSTQITGYLNMTVTVGQILAIGVYHGIKVLRKYLQITKNAKDGATL